MTAPTPAPAPDKLIVSNCERLAQKYGPAGSTAVNTAVKKLIKADAARGIVTVFVDLSDAATMAAYGAVAIPTASAGDARSTKKRLTRSSPFATSGRRT